MKHAPAGQPGRRIQIPIGAEEQLPGRGRPGQDEGRSSGTKLAGHEVRLSSTFPAELVEPAKRVPREHGRGRGRSRRRADGQVPRRRRSRPRTRSSRRLRTRTIASEIVPVLCGIGVQEQGRAAHAGRRDRLPALAAGHAARQGPGRTRTTEVIRKADDDEPFSALAFKIMTDPFVGQADLRPRLLGHAEAGRQRLQRRSRARRSAWAVSCRCTRTTARKSMKSAPATSPPRSA